MEEAGLQAPAAVLFFNLGIVEERSGLMTVFLVISVAVIGLLVAMLLLPYRPEDLSDAGFRHFKAGLLFAILSAICLALIIVLFVLHCDRLNSLRGICFLLVLAGNICNGIGAFCFLRELVDLIPQGNVADITPEGMFLGLLMVIFQIPLLLFGLGLMFAP